MNEIFDFPSSSINSTLNPLISLFSTTSHLVCTIMYVSVRPSIDPENGSLYSVRVQAEEGMLCDDCSSSVIFLKFSSVVFFLKYRGSFIICSFYFSFLYPSQ